MGVKRAVDPSKHVGLVYKIASEYHRDRAVFEDLVQEGALGLVRAAEKFDPKRGNAFSTYAGWWIRAYINRFLLEQRTLMNIAPKALRRMAAAGELPTRISLDKKTSVDGEQQTWHDVIVDQRPNAFDVVERDERLRLIRTAVHGLRLTSQERTILRLAFERDMNNRQIGEVLGISRERVRQILTPILRALRPRLESLQ